jgi:hypothetical protein
VLDSSRSNGSNLILFGRTLLKAINKLHRQKANCSANLDAVNHHQTHPRRGVSTSIRAFIIGQVGA